MVLFCRGTRRETRTTIIRVPTRGTMLANIKITIQILILFSITAGLEINQIILGNRTFTWVCKKFLFNEKKIRYHPTVIYNGQYEMRRAVVKYPLSEKRLTIGKKQMNTIFYLIIKFQKQGLFYIDVTVLDFSIFIL